MKFRIIALLQQYKDELPPEFVTKLLDDLSFDEDITTLKEVIYNG